MIYIYTLVIGIFIKIYLNKHLIYFFNQDLNNVTVNNGILYYIRFFKFLLANAYIERNIKILWLASFHIILKTICLTSAIYITLKTGQL